MILANAAVFGVIDSIGTAQDAVECVVDTDGPRLLQSAFRNILVRGRTMRDLITEGQLRRELDLVLVRLAQCGRAALIEARSEGDRLAGDMFADAQVVASRDLGQLSYERLARRAKLLTVALERVRDGSYGSCEECGSSIPKARRRALPGVTTCLQCQELGESLRAAPPGRQR